jgi:hypothetical protein
MATAAAANIAFLTRSSSYQLLDAPEIRQALLRETWTRVSDSKTGPVRYAADLTHLDTEGTC